MALNILQPSHPLCQTEGGSCAACCGLFNFADRSPPAMHARLQRRTRAVRQADWDVEKLRAAAFELSAAEDADLLFRAVRTCPLAGYLNEEETRVGCLIHPLRHPTGADLRDLGAYGDRAICDGHLCAPHNWLQGPERALLAAAGDWRAYSMTLGESGFPKAVLRYVANARCAEVRTEELLHPDVQRAAHGVLALFVHWPHADPDPRRFGGFSFAGDEAYARTAASAAQYPGLMGPTEATLLDCLGTAVPDEAAAARALADLRAALQPLVDALSR